MHIHQWIDDATAQLEAVGIPSARLDAEIILAHTLRKSRTWLHAYRDETISPRDLDIANTRLDLRADRVPIAYIIGHKEFYGRRFHVTPSTLIPRPESESIIELGTIYIPKNQPLIAENPRCIDVGTGSGVLGITLKRLFSLLDVTLADTSTHALAVAAKNAVAHGVNVETVKSDLLTDYPFSPSVVVANLPYVDSSWERSPETNHEPQEALFAADGGLQLIHELIDQTARRQPEGGLLFLEADPVQHDAIVAHTMRQNYRHLQTLDYGLAFQKTT